MKTYSQFYAEAVVLAKLKGVQGKLNKVTGKFTAGAWSDKESSRYKSHSKPAASKPAASRPAASRPAPAASRPAPKKDDRPTNRQVAAARKEAEYQKNARNLRLGAELGGVAKLAAQQKYSNQNSLAAQGAKAQMAAKNAGTWRTHQFTLDSPAPSGPKNRDYGIPDFVSDRRRENLGAMTDANIDAGMSRADAAAKARRDEAERHRKNMKYMKNRRDGYSD